MGKIERRKSKWTYIGFFIVGILNPVVGLILNHSQTLLVILYVLLLSLAIYFIFFRKAGWKRDFIQWNEESLLIRDGGVEVLYHWEEVDRIVLHNRNLHIKSGAAKGYLMGLRGYARHDLDRFKDFLESQSQGVLSTS